MNHLSAGTLDARQIAHLTADLAALIEDTDTGVEATVSTPTSQAIDLATGLPLDAGTVDTVTGHLAALTEREIDDSGGVYQVGDVRFIVLGSRLSATPSTRTTFTISTTAYAVIRAEQDAMRLAWHLVGRPNQ